MDHKVKKPSQQHDQDRQEERKKERKKGVGEHNEVQNRKGRRKQLSNKKENLVIWQEDKSQELLKASAPIPLLISPAIYKGRLKRY